MEHNYDEHCQSTELDRLYTAWRLACSQSKSAEIYTCLHYMKDFHIDLMMDIKILFKKQTNNHTKLLPLNKIFSVCVGGKGKLDLTIKQKQKQSKVGENR